MDDTKPPETTSDGRRIARLPNSGAMGLGCPLCGCVDSEVLRTTRYPKVVLRRRLCHNLNCQHEWMTSERNVDDV